MVGTSFRVNEWEQERARKGGRYNPNFFKANIELENEKWGNK